MGRKPIRFVCQLRAQDSSDAVNELIRRELASGVSADAVSAVAAAPASAELPRPGTARMRIQAAKPAAAPASEVGAAPRFCAKHPGQPVTDRCRVCGKPMCPKCMELFGYVCSPLCGAKAEAEGMAIPEYTGKKSAVEAKHWRAVGVGAGVVGIVIAGLLGFWFWYAWFGSIPKPVFSVQFSEPAYSGQSVLCGKDQLVFLHGGTLARCDLEAKREIWSRGLIDARQVAEAAALQLKEVQAEKARLSNQDPDAAELLKIPSLEALTRSIELAEESALQLHVSGQMIWVAADGKLVRYGWDTGNPGREIPLGRGLGRVIRRGDELMIAEGAGPGRESITHVNLASGETRVETIGGEPVLAASGAEEGGRAGAEPVKSGGEGPVGLPAAPGGDAGKPLDPATVAEQAQHLSMAGKIALPVVLANDLHQQQVMAEMKDEPGTRARSAPAAAALGPEPAERFSLVSGSDGWVEIATRLVEARFITRDAMKPPPSKSVLDGDLTVTKTAEVANEIANEMQRFAGRGQGHGRREPV